MGGRQVCFFCISFSSRFSFLFLKPSFPLFVVLSFLLRTTLARPHGRFMCVSMRRKRSLRTGRAGDIFGQMGRRGDNPPLVTP